MFLKDFTRTATPGAFTAITPAPAATGLTSDTLVETTQGWCKASDLRIGQRVHTLDGGAAMILGLDRRPVTDLPGVLLPGGLADTCSDLILPRDQYLLTDTLQDPHLPDLDMVLIPATAWASQPCVANVRITSELVTPMFADEEIIWANSGALLHCPSITTGAGRLPLDGFFMALPDADARALLTRRLAKLRA
ncbi:MAG: hypothetical protein ACK4RZ_10015 [Paracoccaceae bacterium]